MKYEVLADILGKLTTSADQLTTGATWDSFGSLQKLQAQIQNAEDAGAITHNTRRALLAVYFVLEEQFRDNLNK